MQMYQNNPSEKISPFTMILKGVVDAAVNGGTDKYKDAFFNEQYAGENPTKIPVVAALKQELHKQLDILQQALEFHKKKCEDDPTVKPLHANLEGNRIVLKRFFC